MESPKDKIIASLKTCRDPELGINIIDLGLIYSIDVLPASVKLVMTLTTPGCPLQPYFHQEIVSRVQAATGIEQVDIELTFDPPWSPAKMSEDAKRQLTMIR